MNEAIKKLIEGEAYYSMDDAIAHAVKLANALEIAVDGFKSIINNGESGDYATGIACEILQEIQAIAEGKADE